MGLLTAVACWLAACVSLHQANETDDPHLALLSFVLFLSGWVFLLF